MKPSKKDRYERHKLLSIPILLCILGYVLFRPSPDASQPADKSTTPAASAAVSPPRIATPSSAGTSSPPSAAWPEVDLEFLSLPSPLANYRIRPSQLAAEKLTATSTAQQLATHNETLSAFGQDLSGSTVNYLFRSERRKLVMLGNHIFEPGDPLTPTVNLHDIQPNALILKLNPSASNSSPATQPID